MLCTASVPFRLAHASTLDEHIILAGEGNGSEGDDQEQVRNVGLGALAPHHFTLGGLADLEDDLLQEVWEFLDNGHGLAGRQADAVHGGRCVVARSAEAA